MVDHSTHSIITKCNAADEQEFLPVYEAYFSSLQDDPARMVYVSEDPRTSFIKLTKKIFTSDEYNLVICNNTDFSLHDPRIITHGTDYQSISSSLLGKINKYGLLDIVVHDARIDYTDQVAAFKILFKYLVPGGIYVIKNPTNHPELTRLFEFCKMLKRSLMEIEFIRVYNGEKIAVIKKIK